MRDESEKCGMGNGVWGMKKKMRRRPNGGRQQEREASPGTKCRLQHSDESRDKEYRADDLTLSHVACIIVADTESVTEYERNSNSGSKHGQIMLESGNHAVAERKDKLLLKVGA